jgi:hypothetical protein
MDEFARPGFEGLPHALAAADEGVADLLIYKRAGESPKERQVASQYDNGRRQSFDGTRRIAESQHGNNSKPNADQRCVQSDESGEMNIALKGTSNNRRR